MSTEITRHDEAAWQRFKDAVDDLGWTSTNDVQGFNYAVHQVMQALRDLLSQQRAVQEPIRWVTPERPSFDSGLTDQETAEIVANARTKNEGGPTWQPSITCGPHCGEDMPGVTVHCRRECCHDRPAVPTEEDRA